MEFMMIRSVKTAAAGNSGGDLSKQSLGLSSSLHHNNLNNSLYQGTATSLSSGSLGVQASSSPATASYNLQQHHHHQQYIQPQIQSTSFAHHYHHHNSAPSSYGNFSLSNPSMQSVVSLQNYTTSLVSNSNYNNNKLAFSSGLGVAPSISSVVDTSGSNGGGGLNFVKKKPTQKLNVCFKSQETIDRIKYPSSGGNSFNNVFGNSGHHQMRRGQFSLNSLSQPQTTPQQTFQFQKSKQASGGMVKIKRMQRVFWERSLKKDTAEESKVSGLLGSSSSGALNSSLRTTRKRKRRDLKPAISLLQPNYKKNRFQHGASSSSAASCTTPPMPNLLKSFSKTRTSASSCSSSSAVDGLFQQRSQIGDQSTKYSGLVHSVKTGDIPPVENIFLKKYDPIKLLVRLRRKVPRPAAAIVKSVISPPKRKIILCNDFPRSQVVTKQAFSSRQVSKSVSNVMRKKKGKRRKLAASLRRQRHNYTLSSYGGNIQVSQPRQGHKGIRLPKYQSPKRKVQVKFRSSNDPGLTEGRIRVLAAVFLKRALYRQRRREPLTNAWFRNRLRLRKFRRRRQREEMELLKNYQAQFKTNRVSKYQQRPSARFHVTNFNLPSPMPIQTRPLSLVDNPFLVHTVELLRHKRELQDRLEAIDSDGTVQKVGPLPDKKDVDLTKLPLLSENVLLKRRQVKHVISQKLLMCLAAVGFTHIKLRPLETMADATSNFLAKMAQRLKEVSEMEMHGTEHGFPDAMERVLNEQGFGGVRGLEEFYRTKVNDYGHRMEEQCLLMRRQYAFKVRSKVGMMSSNVNTPNMSAPSPSSSSSLNLSSVTSAISATSSSIPNSSAITHSSIMMVGGGVGGTSVANGAVVTNKSTIMAVKTSSSTSSSQPLSPGNSVLAEMLSSQVDLASVRTPEGCQSPSLGQAAGSMERQLEELMGAPPPNVEIRPNSFPHPHHQRSVGQQMPLHHLLASLSQQSPQSRAQQQQQQHVHPPPSPQQQALNQVVLHSMHASPPPLTPPTPPHHHHSHLNPKSHQQQHPQSLHSQSCTPGQPQSSQQQSHLTQLLQRPITNQPSPTTMAIPTTPPPPNTTSHHHPHQLILHHHHPQQSPQQISNQYQHHTHHHQAHLNSQNHLNLRNTNINTTTITAATSSPLLLHHHPQPSPQSHQQSQQQSHQASHLHPQVVAQQVTGSVQNSRTIPLKQNTLKTPIDHLMLSGETTYTTNNLTPLAKTVSSNGNLTPNSNAMMQAAGAGGKFITIIRSGASSNQQQQINTFNSNHQNQQDISSLDDGGIISIDLSGLGDVDGGVSSLPSIIPAASSSKAKLKEAISQRNLLRLNFEQVPSGAGDSTVLLSSSSASNQSTAASVSANSSNSVQFIGKVSGSGTGGSGQQQTRMSWNTTNYS